MTISPDDYKIYHYGKGGMERKREGGGKGRVSPKNKRG